ncbi:MAG: aminotransferase class I/II-fold pyridoxal phosphate-dependent enzyme [candidate division Zixibacteria bacterium]|nr:aminotransferase class I/II-fold pyridoxal phosphate-dependent enzyme [candidate division Zixibacteria bacterium]
MSEHNKKEWWKNPHPECKPETSVISAGYDPAFSEMSAKQPIFTTSTFMFKTAEDGEKFFRLATHPEERTDGESPGLIYSRLNNPNMEIVEDKMVVMHPGAQAAAVLPSGLSAISTSILALLHPGDQIIYSAPVYGGTEHMFDAILTKFDIHSHAVHSPELDQYEELLKKHKGSVKMIFIETPTNPTIVHTDVEGIVKLAKKYSTPEKKILVAVDNTFLGPVYQKFCDKGIDLCIYSATKFIGGHSDLIGGFVLGSKADIQVIKSFRSVIGATTDPFCCWLMSRSLETITIRMERCSENAQKIAEFLVKHPQVEKVRYPGLLKKGDPQYDIYKKQCTGPGALLSFYIKGGKEEAFKVLNNVHVCRLAVSLGGTETLIEHPRRMTHSEMTDELCAATDMTDSMIRLSVGVEDADDLINDLDKALKTIA